MALRLGVLHLNTDLFFLFGGLNSDCGVQRLGQMQTEYKGTCAEERSGELGWNPGKRLNVGDGNMLNYFDRCHKMSQVDGEDYITVQSVGIYYFNTHLTYIIHPSLITHY